MRWEWCQSHPTATSEVAKIQEIRQKDVLNEGEQFTRRFEIIGILRLLSEATLSHSRLVLWQKRHKSRLGRDKGNRNVTPTITSVHFPRAVGGGS
jgi:hypothetical protein